MRNLHAKIAIFSRKLAFQLFCQAFQRNYEEIFHDGLKLLANFRMLANQSAYRRNSNISESKSVFFFLFSFGESA